MTSLTHPTNNQELQTSLFIYLSGTIKFSPLSAECSCHVIIEFIAIGQEHRQCSFTMETVNAGSGL